MSDFENNRRKSLDEIEAEGMEENKKQKWNWFNRFNKEREEDNREPPISDNPTFVNFFKMLWRKLNQLLTVNIFMVLGNFPIFFFFLAMSGYLSQHTTSPLYVAYAPLYGVGLIDKSPATSTLINIFSRVGEVTVQTTADYILMGLACLLIITFGPVRVGVTYLVRNMFRGEGIFMWHDFWYAIKRNLKQALIYGFIDVAIVALTVYNIIFYNLNYGQSTAMNMMFFATLCLAVLYFFMRHYIYLMLITFNISIFKMFKNALLFTVLGVKRNALLLLGTIAVAAIEFVLTGLYFPLAVILPFVIIPVLLVLMGVYAAYPKIKEIMIDPYYEKIDTTEE